MTSYGVNRFTAADARALTGKTADITCADDDAGTRTLYAAARVVGVIDRHAAVILIVGSETVTEDETGRQLGHHDHAPAELIVPLYTVRDVGNVRAAVTVAAGDAADVLAEGLSVADELTLDTISTVGAYGVQIVYVGAGDGCPPFSYTAGLAGGGHPEILLVGGIPPEAAHTVLNDLADRVRRGARFTPGGRLSDVIENYDVIFAGPVGEAGRELFPVSAAENLYGGPGKVTVLQLVYPDKDGRWPWDDGYSTSQPLLGEVPGVAQPPGTPSLTQQQQVLGALRGYFTPPAEIFADIRDDGLWGVMFADGQLDPIEVSPAGEVTIPACFAPAEAALRAVIASAGRRP